MLNRMIPLAALSLLTLACGCATIRGDKQHVKFQTDPAGATLTVDGKEKFTTPAEVTLKRKEPHKIEVAKEGYRPIVFNFASEWDGASMTDWAVPGGTALMGLSVATGSDRSFHKLEVIKLEKASGPDPKPLELYPYRGRLFDKETYDRVVEEDRKDRSKFMGDR